MRERGSQGETAWQRERTNIKCSLYNSKSSSQNLKEARGFWEHKDLNSLVFSFSLVVSHLGFHTTLHGHVPVTRLWKRLSNIFDSFNEI